MREWQRGVADSRAKKEKKRIEKQKSDFNAATKKTREITSVGHVFAKGRVGWWLTFALIKIYLPLTLTSLYSIKAQTIK